MSERLQALEQELAAARDANASLEVRCQQLEARESERSEEQRAEELAELDLYEKTQSRLLKWGQTRFWWIVVLGAITLGTTGLGVMRQSIDTMLEGTEKATDDARIGARIATDAAANATRETREAAKAIDAMAQRAAELDSSLMEARAMASNLRTEVAEERSRWDEETDRIRAGLEAVQAEIGVVREATETTDETLEALLKRFGDENLSLRDRASAVGAIGNQSSVPPVVLNQLKTALVSYDNYEFGDESHGDQQLFPREIASSISRLGGDDGFEFLAKLMLDESLGHYVTNGAARGLAATLPRMSLDQVRTVKNLVQENSLELGAVSFTNPVALFYRGVTFEEPKAREEAVGILLWLLDCPHAAQEAMYALQLYFDESHEALRVALEERVARPSYEPKEIAQDVLAELKNAG